MKLALINTFDHKGGAAIATYRLHCGLRSIGIGSHLLVQKKNTEAHNVIGPVTTREKIIAIFRPYLDAIHTKMYPKREKVFFSPAWLPDRLATKVAALHPDLVHLSWVSNGYLNIETLRKFKPPVVWTLHDMWPFTGGCHYDNGCGKFQQACGKCPILHSKHERDLSRRVWERKRRNWKDVPIVIVAPSNWLANMARASSLFKDQRTLVIPNGLDTEQYKPVDKLVARDVYNLPRSKQLMLFSAFSATSDKRKGNQYLNQAIEQLSRSGRGADIELVILGASRPVNPPDMGMKVHYMGCLHDEISKVLLYSAVDVMVAPSIQENLSNTVMESLACGIPVIAFNIGGMPDMIDHRINGYLATPFESTDLATGIMWIIENKNRHDMLSQHARQTVVSRYSLKAVANQYRALYQEILN